MLLNVYLSSTFIAAVVVHDLVQRVMFARAPLGRAGEGVRGASGDSSSARSQLPHSLPRGFCGFSARNITCLELIARSFTRPGQGYAGNCAREGGGGAGRGGRGDGNLSPPPNNSDAQNSSGGGGSSNIPPAVSSGRQGAFFFAMFSMCLVRCLGDCGFKACNWMAKFSVVEYVVLI